MERGLTDGTMMRQGSPPTPRCRFFHLSTFAPTLFCPSHPDPVSNGKTGGAELVTDMVAKFVADS